MREAVSSEETLSFLVREANGSLPDGSEAKFRKTTIADAPAYARDIGTDSAATFTMRLREATNCYVVEKEGRFVHATWVADGPSWVREIQRYFVPPPGDTYIFESYTRPEVRGRGIYPFAIASLAAELGGQGVHRLWVGVEGHNPASMRAVTKAGFDEAFRILYSRRFGHLNVSLPEGPMADVGRNTIVVASDLG
jgi:RimJ/RimL family protein N-acetyltransferase